MNVLLKETITHQGGSVCSVKDSFPTVEVSGQEMCCCFKSADLDIILTGAEPEEALGSDTLRSYYCSNLPASHRAKDS